MNVYITAMPDTTVARKRFRYMTGNGNGGGGGISFAVHGQFRKLG